MLSKTRTLRFEVRERLVAFEAQYMRHPKTATRAAPHTAPPTIIQTLPTDSDDVEVWIVRLIAMGYMVCVVRMALEVVLREYPATNAMAISLGAVEVTILIVAVVVIIRMGVVLLTDVVGISLGVVEVVMLEIVAVLVLIAVVLVAMTSTPKRPP